MLSMKELSDVEGNPQTQADSSHLEWWSALVVWICHSTAPPPKDLESLPGSPDNGLIKETAFYSNKTPRERDTILSLLSYHCLLIIAQFPSTFLDMNFALRELEKLIHDLPWANLDGLKAQRRYKEALGFSYSA